MHTDEEDIIRRCIAGDAESFGILVDRYQTMAYTVAYRMLGDADAANDVAQDGFLSAYRNLAEFRQGSKFSTWLGSIVVNRCRDRLRSGRETVAIEEIAEVRAGGDPDPAAVAEASEEEKLLRSALLQLPPDYREIIVLKHIEEREYEEIAEMLGAGVSALKVRAHRAREMLKGLLVKSGVLR